MKNQIIKVELHDGEILIGKEVQMTEQFLRNSGLPMSAASMFPGIWLLHSNSKKVSFLAHDTIKSKTIMR